MEVVEYLPQDLASTNAGVVAPLAPELIALDLPHLTLAPAGLSPFGLRRARVQLFVRQFSSFSRRHAAARPV